MAEHRKAGKIATFAKELGIQFFCALPFVDKVMDEAQKGVARKKRFERFRNGQWKEHSSIGGEVGIQEDWENDR